MLFFLNKNLAGVSHCARTTSNDRLTDFDHDRLEGKKSRRSDNKSTVRVESVIHPSDGNRFDLARLGGGGAFLLHWHTRSLDSRRSIVFFSVSYFFFFVFLCFRVNFTRLTEFQFSRCRNRRRSRPGASPAAPQSRRLRLPVRRRGPPFPANTGSADPPFFPTPLFHRVTRRWVRKAFHERTYESIDLVFSRTNEAK